MSRGDTVTGADVLDVIVRTGAAIARTRNGQIITRNLPPNLEPAIAEHRTDLALALAGHGTGHRWASCSSCHRPQLIATGKKDRACIQTPGCKGRLKALVKTRPDGTPIELDGQPVPCARPGCERPATRRTAWHELVCTADYRHLALANITRRTPAP